MAIERNGQALKRILAALVAMISLRVRGDAGSNPGLAARTHLPRRLHRAVLRLLRPAESATRRLIIVVARDMSVTLPPLRPRRPKPRSAFLRNGKGTGIVLPRGFSQAPDPKLAQARTRNAARLALPLFDSLPRPGRVSGRHAASPGVPRLSVPGYGAPSPHPEPVEGRVRRSPGPDDPVGTARLRLRLGALAAALDDLPGQALRFARLRSRMDMRAAGGVAPRRIRRVSPLRPGRPPGGAPRPTHEIHEVLADLNVFALQALERSDTS